MASPLVRAARRLPPARAGLGGAAVPAAAANGPRAASAGSAVTSSLHPPLRRARESRAGRGSRAHGRGASWRGVWRGGGGRSLLVTQGLWL